MDVIKRNGRKEPFNEEKIRNSIESAAQDAQYSPQEERELVDRIVQDVKQQVGKVDRVEAGEIRNIVLSDLEQEEQHGGRTDIAASWRTYEEEHGITYKEETSRKHKLDSFKNE